MYRGGGIWPLWDAVALCVALAWGSRVNPWPDTDWTDYPAQCPA